MTTRIMEEPRLKAVRGPWRYGGEWLNARTLSAAAAVAILGLFLGLLWMMRGTPMPRRRVDFPPPPKLDAQIASAQDRLKANPQDLSALVELGTLLFEKGKDSYIEAINALEEARDLGALDARVFYCLGIMYQEEGLFPFALTEYRRFLRHYPDDKEVRMLAAKLEYQMKLYPDAVGDYERLKFMYSTDPLIEENFGLSLWAAKQLDRALASFDQLKTYGGDFARRAEFYEGQIALDAGKFQEAADHFARSGDASSPPPRIRPEQFFTGLATAQQKLSRWEEARAAWEQAKTAWEDVLKTTPQDAEAKKALGEAKRQLAAAKRAAAKIKKT